MPKWSRKKAVSNRLFVDITPQIDAYFARFPDADARRRGNKMARERMTILYDHSARWNALVIGTSNKTELLLGYGTLHGDMASAINPLGDLYKTQVWALAEAIGVPSVIVAKEPSADLWVRSNRRGRVGIHLPGSGQAALLDGRSALHQTRADDFRISPNALSTSRLANHEFTIQTAPAGDRQSVAAHHRP